MLILADRALWDAEEAHASPPSFWVNPSCQAAGLQGYVGPACQSLAGGAPLQEQIALIFSDKSSLDANKQLTSPAGPAAGSLL